MESEIDESISQMVSDALLQGKGEDVDAIAAFCRVFLENILYQLELTDIE